MEFTIKNLPGSSEALAKIVLNLQSELAEYKFKYANLLEEIRLSKQRFFSPSSEKNILQPDLFDEAGVELPDEVKAELLVVRLISCTFHNNIRQSLNDLNNRSLENAKRRKL